MSAIISSAPAGSSSGGGISGSGASGQVTYFNGTSSVTGASTLTFAAGTLSVGTAVVTDSFKSDAANIASAGVMRLGNAELIAARNAGNSADVTAQVTASDIWQLSSGLQLSGNSSASISSSTTDVIVSGGLRFVTSGGVQLSTSSTNLVIGGNCYVNTTSGPLLQNSSGSLRVDSGFRVGGSVETSALLEISSTTKGALFPRMTSVQRNAISSPASGLMVWNSDNSGTLDCYAFSQWLSLVFSPTSTTDNAITRFDGTIGAIQNSAVTVGDLTANKVIVATPSAATTATAVEIQGGACSTAAAVGGNLILRAGAGGSGAERGTVLIGGTANTTGNRPCFGSETDGIGFLGYDYAGGGYKRFGFGYFGTELKVGSTTSTEIGVQIGKGTTSGFISFTRSTANTGPSLQAEYSKCLTVNRPSADGGDVYFSFGNIADNTKNGQFWMHKATVADILWNTDGGGDIGASGANRPNNLYVKTNARISGNLGVGNSAAATTLGTVTKKIEIFDASGSSLGFIPVYDAIT